MAKVVVGCVQLIFPLLQVEKIAPLVYTPTVGQVCQQFGFRFNRARGMYLSISDAGQLSSLVHNWPHDGKSTPWLPLKEVTHRIL